MSIQDDTGARAAPADAEAEAMKRYAEGDDGRRKLQRALREIAEGRGKVADEAYFRTLKERRSAQRDSH